jgi:hypothetical protein
MEHQELKEKMGIKEAESFPESVLLSRIGKFSLDLQKVNDFFVSNHGILSVVDFVMFVTDKDILNIFPCVETFPYYTFHFSKVEVRWSTLPEPLAVRHRVSLLFQLGTLAPDLKCQVKNGEKIGWMNFQQVWFRASDESFLAPW